MKPLRSFQCQCLIWLYYWLKLKANDVILIGHQEKNDVIYIGGLDFLFYATS